MTPRYLEAKRETRLISEKEKIESLNPSQLRRHVDSKMSVIEDNLESFILDAETKQLHITYEIIQIHARQLTKEKFNQEISLSNTFINSSSKEINLKRLRFMVMLYLYPSKIMRMNYLN